MKIVNLGKKTFSWRVKLFFTSLLWATSTSPTRKSWSEFKYGLIDHEHDYKPFKKDKDNNYYYAECKHHGCNIVAVDLETHNLF